MGFPLCFYYFHSSRVELMENYYNYYNPYSFYLISDEKKVK